MQERRYLEIRGDAEEHIEGIEEFERSIFWKVYKSLYRALNIIVADRNKKRGSIISVIGTRGSGKSSTMLSFARSLQEEENRYLELKKCQKARFSVMENLDASMLDTNEDIFDILLSRMLRVIDRLIEEGKLDNQRNYKIQDDILERFDRIYEIHQLIKQQKNRENVQGYSSLSELRRFPDSLELTSEFEKLVEDYLKIVLGQPWGEDREERMNYLVVLVDDLDMNVEHGLQNLEQVYRYVAVKNVIVLIAVKHEQILYQVEKDGYNLFPEINRELDGYKVEYVSNYAKEYLTKVLPLQGRVYMPDMAVNSYAIQNNWYIKDDGSEYTVKRAILCKIRQRTGMCFDICGKKRHFLEPESLRELNGYYVFLDRQLQECMHDDWKKRLSNCENTVEDFLNRIADKKLTHSYVEEIMFLFGLDYAGLNNRLMNFRKGNRRLPHHFRGGYGEILRNLYLISRNDQKDKQFAYAIFFLYTYLAQREFLAKAMKNDYVDRISEVFRESWAGSWSNYLVPKIRGAIDNVSQTVSIGQQPVPWGCMEEIYTDHARIGIEWENCEVETVEDWIVDHTEKTRELEWTLFFFEGFYSELNEKEDLHLRMEKKYDKRVEWTVINSKCDFNILAFIKHSYYFEDYFDKIHTAMAKALVECLGNNIRNSDKAILNTKKALARKSTLYQEYKKWAKKSEGIAVPFHYTDIYYHILHRTQSGLQDENQGTIASDKVIGSLAKVFKRMESLLKEQDVSYQEVKDTSFAENFIKCPFIQEVLNEAKKAEKGNSESFGKLIERCADASVSSRRQQRIESELTTSDELSFRTYDW